MLSTFVMRFQMNHTMRRMRGIVRYAVDRFFVSLNIILALILFAYAMSKLYEFSLFGSMSWHVFLSSVIITSCSFLILVDENRNLLRTVGLMAVCLGMDRALSCIPQLVPHEITSLIPFFQIILGLNLVVSGRSYIKGVTRSRVTMTLSAILIAAVNIYIIVSMILSDIPPVECFTQMPGTVVTIILYVLFIAVLDSAYLRSKDIMEIHNTTLEGIRDTYVQGDSTLITEDMASLLNSMFSDRSSWTAIDDGGPVESECQLVLQSRYGISYMILQKWKGSEVIHATVSDHCEGTLIHAQRFDLIDVFLDGGDVADSGAITLIGRGRRINLGIIHPEEAS